MMENSWLPLIYCLFIKKDVQVFANLLPFLMLPKKNDEKMFILLKLKYISNLKNSNFQIKIPHIFFLKRIRNPLEHWFILCKISGSTYYHLLFLRWQSCTPMYTYTAVIWSGSGSFLFFVVIWRDNCFRFIFSGWRKWYWESCFVKSIF